MADVTAPMTNHRTDQRRLAAEAVPDVPGDHPAVARGTDREGDERSERASDGQPDAHHIRYERFEDPRPRPSAIGLGSTTRRRPRLDLGVR
ncbi:hypothetical protein A8926_4929 [Saccharopolyspora spinosa]|uniref:Uncharacterized protein n=1 Tax=Saccharopolyspora spinosa TaxID=60894 RepID=A0A2N3Y279_SACSN|nr:hypothetical protein A8926_4929 [Saccharopolyspora spinosa]